MPEAGLKARHRWLAKGSGAEVVKRVEANPDHFDAWTAGWRAWGRSLWIGGGWCGGKPRHRRSRPQLAARCGVGRGVAGGPHGTDAHRRWLLDWLAALRDRLRGGRVLCGHWSRVCDSESVLLGPGGRREPAGVFLDPPYLTRGKARRCSLYAGDNAGRLNLLRDEVLARCRQWGQNHRVRAAVCGLIGTGTRRWRGRVGGPHRGRRAAGTAPARRGRVTSIGR